MNTITDGRSRGPLLLRTFAIVAALLVCLPAQAAQAWQRLEAARAVVGDATPRQDGLRLELPLVSEDGAAVPLTVAVDLPMTPERYVESVHLLATGNPYPEVAVFRFSPLAGKAEVSTRIRLNESQTVIAIARTNRGEVFASSRDVRITISGCLVRTGEGAENALTQPRIGVPPAIRAGTVGEVRTLINHPMETGLREGPDGNPLPRRIVSDVRAELDGESVLHATLHQSVSANPYLRFHVAPSRSGQLQVTWTEDSGKSVSHTAKLEVR